MPENCPMSPDQGMRRAFEAEVRLAAVAAAAAFAAHGFAWSRGKLGATKMVVPDVNDVAEEFARLMTDLRDDRAGGHTRSCGRLNVHWGEDGDAHLSMDLGTVEGFFAAASDETLRPEEGTDG